MTATTVPATSTTVEPDATAAARAAGAPAGTPGAGTDAADLRGYRAAHTALLAAPARLAAAARSLDPADRRAVAAIARYWKGYAGEVLAHHTIEDTTVFPALVDRAPVAAVLIERSDRDHHHLDELMDATGAAVATLSAERSVVAREQLAVCLEALDGHMRAHLGFEDADILPLIERTFTREEYRALEDEAHRHVPLGAQAAFTVPFIAAALPPADRDDLLKEVPVPFRLVYRACRGRHARLERRVFGPTRPRAGRRHGGGAAR